MIEGCTWRSVGKITQACVCTVLQLPHQQQSSEIRGPWVASAPNLSSKQSQNDVTCHCALPFMSNVPDAAAVLCAYHAKSAVSRTFYYC
jgi:hypothetical protein